MPPVIKPYTEAQIDLSETGYLKAWVTIKSHFTTLQAPVISSTPVLGEMFTIATAHVWAVGKGAIPLFVEPEALTAPGELVGAKGTLRTLFKPKVVMIGDGAKVLEILTSFYNKEVVLHVQDGCDSAKYIQFGGNCFPTKAIPGSFFESGTLKDGRKGYELTFESYSKYFYTGTITEYPAS